MIAKTISRVLLVGSFVAMADSAFSQAGRYCQVYVDISLDPAGKPSGRTRVSGVDSSAWGDPTQCDLSAYDPKTNTGTISIQTQGEYDITATAQRIKASSSMILKRDRPNQPWKISAVAVREDTGDSIIAADSTYKSATWFVH